MMPGVETLSLPARKSAKGTPELDASSFAVCSRHGEPVARRVDMDVKWIPAAPGAGEVFPKSVAKRFADHPFLPVLGTVARLGSAVLIHTSGWPLCAECCRYRARWSIVTRSTLALAAFLFFGALVLRFLIGQQAWLMAPLLLGPALVLLSVLPFVRGSVPRLTGTRGTPDGSAVLVDHPHPAFFAQAGR